MQIIKEEEKEEFRPQYEDEFFEPEAPIQLEIQEFTATLSDVRRRLESTETPYKLSIEQLEKVGRRCLSPFDKLTELSKVTDVIKEEIKTFWSGVDVKKDKLTLDGD